MKYTLLYDEKAFFDGVRPDEKSIKALSEHFDIIDFTKDIPGDCDVLINLHGKYFPVLFWGSLSCALDRGMKYISVSEGAPLSVPVIVKDGRYEKQGEHTCYHTKFFIQNSINISKDYQKSLAVSDELPLLSGFENAFEISDTEGFILQFTHSEDHPGKCGSSGPVDGAVFPLLKCFDEKGRQSASPVVMLEYYRGDMAGSRHIFINQNPTERFWLNGGCELLLKLADFIAKGSYRFYIDTNYPLYYENERPVLRLTFEHLSRNMKAQAKITVSRGGKEVCSFKKDIVFTQTESFERIPLDFTLESGLYTIECVLITDEGTEHIYHNGFWGQDIELLKNTSKITCDKDYFLKNGQPMPVVGMTYHQSDLHRKFLFLPNPYLWDKDFKDMTHAGINMLRTGVWTGHRQIMFIDGHFNEVALRAFEAFVHTSAKYDIPVVFCLFTFTPEMWEGENCYLDKTSLRAQKRYISGIVERAHGCSLMSWDLINEPSVCNPGRLWSTRPNGDRFELAAWHEFLKKKHGTIERLWDNWNVTPQYAPSFDAVPFPEESSFNDNPTCFTRINSHPALDYHLFAVQIFNSWIDEMTDCIKKCGNDNLVTVGQDETLPGKKPHALLYQNHVDYVCNHSWWLMDGLYFDGVFSKPASKPCLIQETGIMYVANADSTARRSFELSRNILERKFALAYGAGCAGAVHWIWNTNCHMNDINEAHIGGILADGSHKRETQVSYDFGEFIKSCGKKFKDKASEKVAVVMPFSSHFSSRDYASRVLVSLSRMLGYDFYIPFQALSEYELDDSLNYDVIFISSPRILTQKAFEAIKTLAEKGATVVITGVYFQDEYFKTIPGRAELLGTSEKIVCAEREEKLIFSRKILYASYGGDALAFIDKVKTEDGKNIFKDIKVGYGRIIWSNIPIEISGGAAMPEIYLYALATKNIKPFILWNTEKEQGIFIRRFDYKDNYLYVIVSENGADITVDFKDAELLKNYRFELSQGRAAMFMTDKSGKPIESLRNIPIMVY